jgi:hypothetical protein
LALVCALDQFVNKNIIIVYDDIQTFFREIIINIRTNYCPDLRHCVKIALFSCVCGMKPLDISAL